MMFSFFSLFGSQTQTAKSAVVYYGDDISYSMLGANEYIIVQAPHINTTTPGFQRYKKNIYAYVSIGEIEKWQPQYDLVDRSWVVATNDAWQSDVLDIKNEAYQEFVITKILGPLYQQGFENFFFDTLDSYEFYTQNDEQRAKNRKALSHFINKVHAKFPKAKIVVNRGFEIIDDIHQSIEAVLFESYYKGLRADPKDPYKDVSDADREWFDIYLKKINAYHKDIISVEYLDKQSLHNSALVTQLKKKLQEKSLIPYITTRSLMSYGKMAKNIVKREVFTLINPQEINTTKRSKYASELLEYMGYIQHLHNIQQKALPEPKYMHHYAGVLVWLESDVLDTQVYIEWIKKLIENKIPILFIGNFGVDVDDKSLEFLGINTHMLDKTPVSLKSWGGYVYNKDMKHSPEALLQMKKPTLFLKKLLHLQDIPVADTTTYNQTPNEYTTYSLVNDGDGMWSFYGLDKLNTIRFNHKNTVINRKKSSDIIRIQHYLDATYIKVKPHYSVKVAIEQ